VRICNSTVTGTGASSAFLPLGIKTVQSAAFFTDRQDDQKNVDNGHRDVNGSRPTGNSAAAALRRLERQRPDLLDRVLAGELSPHAAMITAGFRKGRRFAG
jgi:hypothetical protein